MPMRETDSPRGIAVQVLQDAASGRPVAAQLDSYLRLYPADDPTFVAVLVHGVRQHRARLDFHIDASTRRNPQGRIRQALRIAAFELLELDSPPEAVASAVVRILPVEWIHLAAELIYELDRQRDGVDERFSARHE